MYYWLYKISWNQEVILSKIVLQSRNIKYNMIIPTFNPLFWRNIIQPHISRLLSISFIRPGIKTKRVQPPLWHGTEQISLIFLSQVKCHEPIPRSFYSEFVQKHGLRLNMAERIHLMKHIILHYYIFLSYIPSTSVTNMEDLKILFTSVNNFFFFVKRIISNSFWNHYFKKSIKIYS